MRNSILFLVLAVSLALSACQPAAPADVSTAYPPAYPPQTEGTPAVPPAAGPMVDLAIQALKDNFDIPADAVTVSGITPMTWPDASLGCPRRGVLYIQAVTPGYEILLEANGHTFNFHTDEKSLVVLCSVTPPDEIYPTP